MANVVHLHKSNATNSLSEVKKELEKFLHGKEKLAEAILCSVLAEGHLLFEDIPGVGKTTLIKALSQWLGLSMTRIQCTSDLLPSDILGVEVYQNSKESFVFQPGPIFSNFVFVDELNRASPRTQSALLEAMAEGVVTIQKKSYPLPKPFLIIAAQNPSTQMGTYALPESQWDRFSACLSLGYPSEDKEMSILESSAKDQGASSIEALATPEALSEWQRKVNEVTCARRVSAYARRLLDNSRKEFPPGFSTRAGVLWMRMAKARAVLHDRNYVLPDDLIEMAAPSLSHRIPAQDNQGAQRVQELLQKTPVD